MSPTDPDDSTRAADEDDARSGHGSDRMPTGDEEAAAERSGAEVPDSVAEAYEEAAETGANVQGEGRI